MDKSIHKILNVHHSPRFKPWAIITEMVKTIAISLIAIYSPRINSWAIIAEMVKTIAISLIAIYSPRFKPWAMGTNNAFQTVLTV